MLYLSQLNRWKILSYSNDSFLLEIVWHQLSLRSIILLVTINVQSNTMTLNSFDVILFQLSLLPSKKKIKNKNNKKKNVQKWKIIVKRNIRISAVTWRFFGKQIIPRNSILKNFWLKSDLQFISTFTNLLHLLYRFKYWKLETRKKKTIDS